MDSTYSPGAVNVLHSPFTTSRASSKQVPLAIRPTGLGSDPPIDWDHGIRVGRKGLI